MATPPLDTEDYLDPIPLSQRRSPLTMGLLWLTMVTSFPAVLAGFDWYHQGFSFSQIIICSVLSLALLLAYSIPACELGARSGLGYCTLSTIVFGKGGAILATANLLWLFTAWYGLTAVLMAQAFAGLFHCQIPLVWLSIIFALLMSVNNLFGFTGVANFARFMAGPVLTIWVGYVFFKALHSTVSTPAQPTGHPSMLYALPVISSFIIGFAVWGNEQDYWRFSKPGVWRSALPLTVALFVGQILFPIAGWLIAAMSGSTDYGSATAYMTKYCFGSITLIGLIIIISDYFSTNDSSLFGSAVAMENIRPLGHNLSVILSTIAGVIVAALIALGDATQALSTMVSINCILLPTPTIIMITEWFLRAKVFRLPNSSASLNHNNNLPSVHWPAVIALLSGLTVGIITSGLIPIFECCHFGMCSLQAWLTSIIIYIPLRMHTYKIQNSHSQGDILA